jgi:rubrerythrin
MGFVDRLAARDHFACSVCGNAAEGATRETCPILGALRRRFMRIE